jgi:hypothetical protein
MSLFAENADEIYRYEVSADEEVTVASLSPFSGQVIRAGVEVEDFYDY